MRDQNGVTALKLWSSESLSPGESSGVGTHALVKIAATSRTKAPILPQQVTNVVSKPMQYGGPTPSVSSPGGMRPYAFARTRYFFFFSFFPALIVHKLPSPAYTTYTHTNCFKKAAAPCNQTQNGHVLWRCCNHQHRPVLHKLLSGSCNSPWNKLMPVTAAHAQSLKHPPNTATRGCTFLEHMTTQKGHARTSTWTALRH